MHHLNGRQSDRYVWLTGAYQWTPQPRKAVQQQWTSLPIRIETKLQPRPSESWKRQRQPSKGPNLVYISVLRLSKVAGYMTKLVTIIVIVSFVSWNVLPVLAFLASVAYWLQTIRKLPRLMEIQSAAVVHRFEEFLSGFATIRAFHWEPQCLERLFHLVNLNNCPMEFSDSRDRHPCRRLLLRFDAPALCLPQKSRMDESSRFQMPGSAGVAVTYALSLTTVLTWTLWSRVDTEKRIISAELLLHSLFPNVIIAVRENEAATGVSPWRFCGALPEGKLVLRESLRILQDERPDDSVMENSKKFEARKIRACPECQTLIEHHDLIKLLSNVHNNLNTTCISFLHTEKGSCHGAFCSQDVEGMMSISVEAAEHRSTTTGNS
ncbi:hypothetical protein SELMODRAFT_419260 [Selaginella moellendorffii]|uniref:ABC transmembrane type-1 domain-containing protein n=1 Tax=Selaginella moellendorffii TaxID=88036 RepID=D8S8C7_SELML|nr:hypothetical protein SELMODRAFT_419260 [Selaginella moellendorffii]